MPTAIGDGRSPLTRREVEVIRLIAQDLTNKEIAAKLRVSVKTVDFHRRGLKKKIGAKGTAGIIRYAIKHRLIEP
jgi:DNA-binding CsgD family transcriptional regulator